MLNNRLRKALARGATLAAVTGVLAVVGPSVAANAACVPVMDVTQYPPYFDHAELNTTTGANTYFWGGDGYVDATGCAGTVYLYLRVTDRSIVPAGPIQSTNWRLIEQDFNPDGGDYGYRGGFTVLEVEYQASFTSPMRGTLGQVTAETKAVFVASTGPTTTVCKAYTKTFSAGPTAPTDISETPEGCLP